MWAVVRVPTHKRPPTSTLATGEILMLCAPGETSLAHSPAALIAVHDGHDLFALQLRRRLCELAEFVVCRAAAVLLPDSRQGLYHGAHYSLSRDTAAHIATDTLHDPGTSPPATASTAASRATTQTYWASGSSQLCHWCNPHLVSGQEVVVLHKPPCWLCNCGTSCYAPTSRDACCTC